MNSKKEEIIKILSYNILAQNLLKDSLHITEEEIDKINYLNIDYRFNKIFETIEQLNPDICLFQEFEQNGKLKDLFKSKNLAYEIIFKKRPGDHQEGCAIVYNKKKFRLEYYTSLEFRSVNNINSPETQKYDYYNKNNYFKKYNPTLFNKENVASIVLLQSYETSFYYLIVCTHLLFNNNRGDIKLGQIYQLIKAILLIKNYYKNISITTILGADLNSSYNSAIYEFITKKELNVEFLIKYNLSGQNMKEYISENSLWDENFQWYNEIINTYPKFNDYKIILITKKYKKNYYDDNKDKKMILENKVVMKSFYKEKNGKEPNITSYSTSFKGTLDFLFYNTDLNIEINKVLDTPELNHDIPDINHPSDHLPLFAEFKIHK